MGKGYTTKALKELSCYQPISEISLNFIDKYQIPLSAAIMDVGGGDCFFVDYLLTKGFEEITLLDISATAIERAKRRLGASAHKIHWVVADIGNYVPQLRYDFWYDHAAFQFLIDEADINDYMNVADSALVQKGFMVLGTFSEHGPTQCSGIPVKQYRPEQLSQQFNGNFECLECSYSDHTITFNTTQNFTFCSFQKRVAR